MKNAKVLVVDDDQQMRASLAHLLETAGFDVTLAKDAQQGLNLLRADPPDVILSDVRMPGMDGLAFQTRVRDVSQVPVILITAHGDIPMAVAALQDGAYSFVEKPFEPRRLLGILKNAVRMKQLMDNTAVLQERLVELTDLERILIGNNADIIAARDKIFDFAASTASVLILGQTGTGKELVARALHDLGTKPGAPFVAVNCAVIPPDRFEETVFGTASAPHGLLSGADGGTLFLDELGSMPFETQSKILRAIETKQYQRLGSGLIDVHSQ
jgi:DNA-binding NtrC family response regulator